MTEPVLEIRGVSKSFGALKACDDISLEVRRGEVHALIGPERRRQDHLDRADHRRARA